LYRAVDSAGASIDCLLSARRDAAAAKRFFQKALSSPNHPTPRVINVDKNPSYPPVVEALKSEGTLQRRCRLRPVQYINNVWSKIIEPSSGACERAKAFARSGEPTARFKVMKQSMQFGRGKPDGWESVRLSGSFISSQGYSRLQSDATPASCLSCATP
jgi:transposase-like protein